MVSICSEEEELDSTTGSVWVTIVSASGLPVTSAAEASKGDTFCVVNCGDRRKTTNNAKVSGELALWVLKQ